MKPESHRAFLELSSFGIEELTSEQANHLLQLIDECPECHGQWLLFKKTITYLSSIGEAGLPPQRAEKMWLVCMDHARKKSFPLNSSNGQSNDGNAK